MAQVNRKTRYILEYIANTGPLKRVVEMQRRLNQNVHAGSAAVNSFGRTARAAFTSVYGQVAKVTSVVGALGGAFGSVLHRIRTNLVVTRFEVAALGVAISGVLTRLTTGGIRATAAAEDIRNQFDVSFSQVHEKALELVQRMKEDLKLSEVTIKGFLSSTQDLLVGFGMTQQAALGLSDQIVRLSLDLASWNNVPFETAMHNMLSGLVGNHEALRSLRIMITQATLDRKREELGIRESWDALNESTKVYLRYRVAVQQSVNAIGDLQRTMHETNNRFRFFSEQVKTITLSLFPKLTYWTGEIAEKIAVWLLNNEKVFRDLGDYLARLGYHLSGVTDMVLKFFDKWSELHQATKELLMFSSGVAGIAIPLLGVLVIFGRALSVVSVWYTALLAVALVLQDIYAVMNGGNGYFRQFLEYTGMSIKDITTLKDRIINFGKSFTTSIRESTILRDLLSSLWNMLVLVGQVVIRDVIPAFRQIVSVFSSGGVLGDLLKFLNAMITITIRWVGLIFAILTGNTERITEHFLKIKAAFISLFVGAFKFIGKVLINTVTTFIPKIFKGLISVVMNIIGLILSTISQMLVSTFKWIFKAIASVVSGAFSIVKRFFTGIWDLVIAIRDVFKQVFENTVMSIFTGMFKYINKIIDKISGITNYIPKWLKRRLEKDSEDPNDSGKPAGVANPKPKVITPKIGETPIIPTAGKTVTGSTSSVVEKTVGASKTTGVSIQIGDIQMPINLPESFSGNPEEFRKIAASEAEKVFTSALSVAYNDNSGE